MHKEIKSKVYLKYGFTNTKKTQHPAELPAASKYLEAAAQSNLPLFLKELSKGS